MKISIKIPKFILNIQFLFMPKYWTMLGYYDKHLDKWLSDAIKLNRFKILSQFEAEIGGKIFWIENYPYGSFTLSEKSFFDRTDPNEKARPSRLTIKRAWEKLQKEKLGLSEQYPQDKELLRGITD